MKRALTPEQDQLRLEREVTRLKKRTLEKPIDAAWHRDANRLVTVQTLLSARYPDSELA